MTKGIKTLSNHKVSLLEMDNCYHEEADSRIFVHAIIDLLPCDAASSQGSKSIMVKVNDTDVLIIGLIVFPTLQGKGLEQLWLAFGQDQSLR